MRAVIQRVTKASVLIDGKVHSSIENGLLVLVAVEDSDTQNDIIWLAQKIIQLRIFSDENGAMNLNVEAIDGSLLVVSQFTLLASTKKGNRPSFTRSSKPDIAIPLYESFVSALRSTGIKAVNTGVFGADMKVELINDGPATIIIDTKLKE